MGQWLLGRKVAELAGKDHFLYLTIAPARLFMQKLQNAMATRMSRRGRTRMTHQLRRDSKCGQPPPLNKKLKLKLFTTCAGKLDRLLSLGPLHFAIQDLLVGWARVSSTRYTYRHT
jgi:hypothetical protein